MAPLNLRAAPLGTYFSSVIPELAIQNYKEQQNSLTLCNILSVPWPKRKFPFSPTLKKKKFSLTMGTLIYPTEVSPTQSFRKCVVFTLLPRGPGPAGWGPLRCWTRFCCIFTKPDSMSWMFMPWKERKNLCTTDLYIWLMYCITRLLSKNNRTLGFSWWVITASML